MVILIAEDNLGVRVWLWQLLKNDGHTVIAVKDGEDALNALVLTLERLIW